MRASALAPTKRPEIINLRRTARNVETNLEMLKGTYERMPGLLQGMAKWNYIIREDAMQKFRLFFRHGHPIAVFTAKPDQEYQYCPACFKTEVSFSSHEYRVAFLTYKGLYRNQRGNWQWNSDEGNSGADVELLGFFFYWYGLVTIDDNRLITSPEFLKKAADSRRLKPASTAPFPLSALKNDFARERNDKEVYELTKGTLDDVVEKRRRRAQKMKEKKELMTEPLAHVPGLPPSSSSSVNTAATQGMDEAARGDVRGLPGAEHSSSEDDGEEGAQDALDKAAEGPLGAKNVGRYKPDYSPTDGKKTETATLQPTGSDRWWKEKLLVQSSRYYSDMLDAVAEIYECPICDIGYPISMLMFEHLATVDGGRGCLWDKQLGCGQEVQVDQHTDRPKFVFNKPQVSKITWIGRPLYEQQDFCRPSSLETLRYDELRYDELVQDYRKVPTGQLKQDDLANDLIRRVGYRGRVEDMPLIPVPMTSKLWWTRMTDIPEGVPSVLAGTNETPSAVPGSRAGTADMGEGSPGSRAGDPEPSSKQPFKTMSTWRNLVRAWEMRHYEDIRMKGWTQALNWRDDPYPGDMSILTQGATMTPTMMLEGRWDTWSYSDLMIPNSFFEMLKKDAEGEDNLNFLQKQHKWSSVVEPLCSTLGYLLMKSDGRAIFHSDGVGYYTMMAEGMITSVQKCVRVPDPSIHVNHELIHYVAQSYDCADLLQLWKERAEGFSFFDGRCRFPATIISKLDKQRGDYEEGRSGIQKAMTRYTTLPLHDTLSVIADGSQHRTVLPDFVYQMNIWVRGQTKQVDGDEVVMDASYQGRTPLLFVRSTSPTRRSEMALRERRWMRRKER
eukprot:919334-Amphidinium_carterae.3